MKNEICAFLSKHNFVRRIDINATIASLLADMNSGLQGHASDQPMLKTWCTPPEKKIENEKVIVIDAGGTNFRSCLVTFSSDGIPSISEMEKTVMPGVAKELGKKDFFAQMAANLDHLKNKADKIGFCFSYAMKITDSGDGILQSFSKEVKAPEVVGCAVGKELSAALVERGWNKPKSVALLNDTVAALLAGAASGQKGKSYSSYVGFILGTGLNSAYIQPSITYDSGEKFQKQIIVCESGSFAKICRSDFDIAFDNSTLHPGEYIMEKQCSGGYLGSLSLVVLKNAAKENLFSKKMAAQIAAMEKLTLIDVNTFLHGPYDSSSLLGKMCIDSASKNDYEVLFELLDAIVERSARYAASMLAAAVIQSGGGKDLSRPVCILCNGTTFHKTYKIAMRTAAYLEDVLFNEKGLSFELVSVENDITLGAAIAGLIER